MKTEIPAFHMFAAARGNAEAAKMIRLSPLYPQKAIQVHLPLCNQIALSLELHLKAWLSHKGIPEKIFSAPKIRHDLEGLYDLAVSNGLNGLHPDTRELAKTLGPFYKNHEYRYLPPDVTMPTLNHSLVFAVLDVLDTHIGDAIDAKGSAAKALAKEAAAAKSI